MPIWLYCQSCQQWSKSDGSLSADKSCPVCSNLYITLKPVIDSNPYKVKVDLSEPPSASQPSESAQLSPAQAAVDQESDPVASKENDPAEEPGKDESLEEPQPEIFDFVEILEAPEEPGAARDNTGEGEKKPAEKEQVRAALDQVCEEDSRVLETGVEEENPSDTPLIQVLGKVPQVLGGPEIIETGDKTENTGPVDSSPKKKRLKPR